MLMIRVNVPLQISRGILVYGETTQMHEIRERNCIVIKLPHNATSKAKEIKKSIQFTEVIKHN